MYGYDPRDDIAGRLMISEDDAACYCGMCRITRHRYPNHDNLLIRIPRVCRDGVHSKHIGDVTQARRVYGLSHRARVLESNILRVHCGEIWYPVSMCATGTY